MNETDLHSLLERATDRIEPDLVGATLTARGTVVRRRRWAAGTAAAAAAVVVVAGTLALGQGARPEPVPAPLPPTTPTVDPTPVDRGPEGPATQALWDPFALVDAPVRPSGLPDPIAPAPRISAVLTVAEDPMEAAALAWPAEDADLRLLGTDGRWRLLPETRDALAGTLYPVVRPVLSPDGTEVAMAVLDGIRVVDVTDGSEQTVPWPAALAPPWDTAPGLQWLPDDGFLVLHWRETWRVGRDGSAEPAPYVGSFPSLAVDPEGPVYQNDYLARRLLTWEGDEVVQEAPLHQCERMVARFGLMACTTGSLEPFRSGPLVVDPETGEVLAYAPIKDRNSVYSDNGHLTALGFLDPDTVLLSVLPADFRRDVGGETVHLVAWRFRTGTFERITSGGAGLHAAAVAADLLD